MRVLRWSLGLALLILQLCAIVYARFVPSRYFCWAPFDMQTDYRLEVIVNGRHLSPAEIRERYRKPVQGTDNRSFQHIIDIVEQAERRYHPDDHSDVRMLFRVNGKQEQEWRFRQP